MLALNGLFVVLCASILGLTASESLSNSTSLLDESESWYNGDTDTLDDCEADATDRSGNGGFYRGSNLKITTKSSAHIVVKASTEYGHPMKSGSYVESVPQSNIGMYEADAYGVAPHYRSAYVGLKYGHPAPNRNDYKRMGQSYESGKHAVHYDDTPPYANGKFEEPYVAASSQASYTKPSQAPTYTKSHGTYPEPASTHNYAAHSTTGYKPSPASYEAPPSSTSYHAPSHHGQSTYSSMGSTGVKPHYEAGSTYHQHPTGNTGSYQHPAGHYQQAVPSHAQPTYSHHMPSYGHPAVPHQPPVYSMHAYPHKPAHPSYGAKAPEAYKSYGAATPGEYGHSHPMYRAHGSPPAAHDHHQYAAHPGHVAYKQPQHQSASHPASYVHPVQKGIATQPHPPNYQHAPVHSVPQYVKHSIPQPSYPTPEKSPAPVKYPAAEAASPVTPQVKASYPSPAQAPGHTYSEAPKVPIKPLKKEEPYDESGREDTSETTTKAPKEPEKEAEKPTEVPPKKEETTEEPPAVTTSSPTETTTKPVSINTMTVVLKPKA